MLPIPGVYNYIKDYFLSDESILVLQGPAGTGKTRFIRAILAEISKQLGRNSETMFTSDFNALDNDELFIDFVTGDEDVFVVEDADQLLQARTSGNKVIHKFLNISDGIIRSQGRKIIFSTNLPNVKDIDEALLRPGRCYDHLKFRELDCAETRALAKALNSEFDKLDKSKDAKVKYSLAEIYKAL